MKKNIFTVLIGCFSLFMLSTGEVSAEKLNESTEVSTSSTSTTEKVESSTSSIELDTTETSTTKTSESKEEVNNVEKELIKLEKLQYVSFIKDEPIIFKDNDLKELVKLSEIENVLLKTDTKFIFNEKTYYVLTDLKGSMIGVVEESEIKLHDTLDSEKADFNKYVSLNQDKAKIYKNLELEFLENHSYVKGQTFLAKEQVKHVNGKNYYTLYSVKEEMIGYVLVEDVSIAESQGGIYQSFGKYVTVTNNQSSTLSNFDGKEKHQTNKLYKNTYLARGKYHHFDGSLYYSLYDSKGVWYGYLNEKDAKIVDGAQGAYHSLNQYVIMNSPNYPIWQNFDWKEKNKSKKFYQRTFLAKGEYHHYNGETYYSLFDLNDKWYGYINKNAMKQTQGSQGDYVSFNKYVTVKNENGSTWNSFDWNRRHKISSLANQTLKAKGVYYHANGNDYYSLYDNNNVWKGYINKDFVKVADGAQGSYQNFGKYVTITKNNYDMWRNFSWNSLGKTNNKYNKTYLAKGQYRHFNGATYYSLFDNKGTWLGYVNKNGVTVADGAQGIYQSYGKEVMIVKSNYPMWSDFSWNEKGNTSSYMKKKFNARGKYQHFNGSTYVSLYDNKGKWYGYLNESAVSSEAEKMEKVQVLLNSKYNSYNYGIYVTSLVDGSTASMNGSRIFTAASTGKLPAMYYTQKMINQGKIDPNRKYLYTDAINQMPIYSYMRGGAGILQGKPFGTYYSLDTMLNWTAKYSDNQGANFLGYYGANQYDYKMRSEISSIIGRQWQSPFQISAKENALLISAMYRQGGQVMSYMQNTVFDDQRIPKYLPVRVAHKIGDVGSFRHDVAVVYTDTPYVLSVMTQNNTSYETISILSKEIYDIMK
ncbi:serine hydrolase [Vagococcus hydrophili]|uniref:Serine hydrolase n=1 Tax=Vagococcus hydrophili TaxID=2714947 RepID=A0A6G8AQW6_9ENTE|nr:serine hydrolase [Vagococcus hydrophili]QIL47387.1 serine hydrolase [Vagococcus hydrophili]